MDSCCVGQSFWLKEELPNIKNLNIRSTHVFMGITKPDHFSHLYFKILLTIGYLAELRGTILNLSRDYYSNFKLNNFAFSLVLHCYAL